MNDGKVIIEERIGAHRAQLPAFANGYGALRQGGSRGRSPHQGGRRSTPSLPKLERTHPAARDCDKMMELALPSA